MANTTNFGWETPDDTDLVKDGALAMRTLGNAIDTSLVDLKGGTTGQVLSKNTNTDMDFVWTTPNVGDITEVQAGTGISVASGTGPIPVVTNTVATAFDAKGDLVVGTGADTFAKLTVGANNTVLTADSSTATGLKWATAAAGGMTQLATGSITGTTTVSNLSQNYKDLVFYLKGVYNSSGLSIDPYFRFNSDTSQVYGTVFSSAAGTGIGAGSNAVVTGYDNAANVQTGFIMLRIYDYANTTTFKTFDFVTAATESGGTTFVARMGRGVWRSTAAVSSMNWHEGNGRAITGGTYEVYGVN